MTIRNREEAARAAEATQTNAPGMCQQVVRGWFNAPSVGDVDGDGSSDAEDGFKSEPASAVHTDRNPPRGTPLSFLGGRNDHGHRAISIGQYANGEARVRSTDFNGITKRSEAGVVGNGTIAELERAMGVTYRGWSETISGQKIPLPPAPEPEPKLTEMQRIRRRLQNLHKRALDNGKDRRANKIRKGLLELPDR